jgi:hypothetical protein
MGIKINAHEILTGKEKPLWKLEYKWRVILNLVSDKLYMKTELS